MLNIVSFVLAASVSVVPAKQQPAYTPAQAIAADSVVLTPEIYTKYIAVIKALFDFWQTKQKSDTAFFRKAGATVVAHTVAYGGPKVQANIYDYPTLIKQDTTLAGIFTKNHMTPEELVPLHLAVLQAVMAMSVAEATNAALPANTTALGKNVELLKPHRQELAGSASQGEAGDRGVLLQQTPDTIVLSDSAPSASFTLTNLVAQDVDVWLAPECPASSYLVLPADPVADAWHNQSTCAIPWLDGYPRHITLTPHERRTLTMRVVPPSTLPQGHYTARLIWAIYTIVRPQGDSIRSHFTAGPVVTWSIDHDELEVTYNRGPQSAGHAPPQHGRTQWVSKPPARHIAHVTPVGHTPAVLVLNDRTRTASFTLTNPAAKAIDVWLAVDCPWFQVNFADFPLSHQFESAWHGRIPNASLWLGGFPQHLKLAPHERRTLTLQASSDISLDLPAGSYYARLLYVQAPVRWVVPGGDTMYVTPQGSVDVVYHRYDNQGVPPAPLTLSQLQTTRQQDGTVKACVRVQQPGIGLIATLHAEINHVHGQPVSPHTPTRRPLWTLDTTVVVWEVVHHNPMQDGADEEPMVPPPVCFPLPALPSGHDQLVVSATALGTTTAPPARETLPLDFP